LLLLAVGCLAAGSALAEVSIHSTHPESVSVTIYRDGIALVTETRHVEMPAEPVTLVFQGVVDSLLPRSAVISGAGRPLAEADFRHDRLTPASLLKRSVGKVVTIVRTAPRSGVVTRLEATIESADQGVVLRTVQGNEALFCSGLPERLEFAEVPGELTPTPTLSVRLGGGNAGMRTVTLSYLARGFSWSADYVAQLNKASSRMDLAGWITLRNETNSGFRQAQVQVVAGRLNLIPADDDGSRPPVTPWLAPDQIDEESGLPVTAMDLAREDEESAVNDEIALLRDCYPLGRSTNGLPAGMGAWDVVTGGASALLSIQGEELQEIQVTGSRIVSREQLGDYQLYRLPWPTDLNARQTKQAAFLDKRRVKVQRFYDVVLPYLEATRPYPEDAAHVVLKWQNTRAAGLGEPLPAGQVRVFQAGQGGMVFAGEAGIDDKPVGLPAEIFIARAMDLMAEFTLQNDDRDYLGGGRLLRIEAGHRFREPQGCRRHCRGAAAGHRAGQVLDCRGALEPQGAAGARRTGMALQAACRARAGAAVRTEGGAAAGLGRHAAGFQHFHEHLRRARRGTTAQPLVDGAEAHLQGRAPRLVDQCRVQRLGQCLRTHLALEEFRHHPFARQQVGQGEVPQSHEAEVAHDECRQRRQAIGHHHGQAMQHRLQRGGAGGDEAGIGRGQHLVGPALQQPHIGTRRTQLRVERAGQRRRHHRREEAQWPTQPLLQQHRGGGEIRTEPPQLAFTAARQHGHHQLVFGQSQLPAGIGALRLQWNAIRQWMPDELRAHRLPRIALRLEWQQAQHGIDGARDGFDPATAPGPHLRADVLHSGHAAIAQPAREAKVECRRVHADEQVDTPRQQFTPQAAAQ